MQVNAPDLFAPFGSKSSAHEKERPGDDRFGALLREDEARNAREPSPTRQAREAERPANDDVRRGEPRREEVQHDRPPRDERVERHESAAGETVAQTRPPQSNDRPEETFDGQATTVSGEADVTATSAVLTAAAGETGAGQPTTPEAAAAPLAESASSTPEATVVVSTTQSVPQPDGTRKAVDPSAPTGAPTGAPAGTASGATQPAGEAAAATPETTAQPASGAAMAQRAADKASPTATAKDPNQVAATHRQSPTVAPAETGKRPSGNAARDSQNNPQPGVAVATTTTAAVEARPAASLGGAAATAALAQQSADGRAATPAENPPATADASQPAAGNKTTAQPAQGGKTPEALAAMADKAAGAGQPSAPSAADTASATTGQTATPTAAAAAGAPGTGLVHNTSFAEALATARPNPAANPAEQIAIQVQRAQVAGQEKITIKLHPAELGRIEVKLEHSSDGTLRAVLSAERPETLDLLQRDARGLERALQEAGLKTDSGSLNFSLRGQSHGQDQQAGGNDRAGHGGRDGTPEGADAEAMTAQAQQHRSSHSGTLDIQV